MSGKKKEYGKRNRTCYFIKNVRQRRNHVNVDVQDYNNTKMKAAYFDEY